MSAEILARLLRSPGDIAAACRGDRAPNATSAQGAPDLDVRTIAAASMTAIVVGGAAFGGVVGSFRGGSQIAFGAIKVPLAMLATLALCAPAFHAVAAVLGRPWPIRSIIALVLAAAGRASLLLLAFAPALWLILDFGLGYHKASLCASAAYGVAGLAAISILIRGLGDGHGRAATALAFLGIFFAIGGQTAWILRPYLGRPSAESIPFLRAREGSFSDAVVESAGSATRYRDVGRRDLRRAPPVEIGEEE
jgi:hypothetical protein